VVQVGAARQAGLLYGSGRCMIRQWLEDRAMCSGKGHTTCDCTGAKSEHCTAGMNGEQVYRTERANVSWWPKQGNIRPRSGVIKVPFPPARHANPKPAGDPRKVLEKTDVAGRYVAGSYQGYVGGYVAGLLG